MLALSSFSPTEVTDQKQIKFSLLGDVLNINAADKTHTHTEREREREREKDTKQLYRFLPQTGSSPVPLTRPRRVH